MMSSLLCKLCFYCFYAISTSFLIFVGNVFNSSLRSSSSGKDYRVHTMNNETDTPISTSGT